MKINHDLRHKISVMEAQGKSLIEQKVELEAGAQTRGQEVGALRQEVARLRERLQGDLPGKNPEEPSPAEVPQGTKKRFIRGFSPELMLKLVLGLERNRKIIILISC